MDRKLPVWASSPPPGYPGAIQPPAPKTAAGWQNGEEPPAGTFNWVFQAVSDVDNEVANAIVGMGAPLDAARTDQLLTAIRRGRAVQAMGGLRLVKDVGSGTLNALARAPSTGTVVAVGAAAKIYSGGNGADFVPRTAAPTYVNDFNDVLFDEASGLFLAIGNSGEIQSSPTGAAWTRRATAGANLYAIATSGAGRSVAVGAGGNSSYSSNGVTWTTGTFGLETNTRYVAYVNNAFVAVNDYGDIFRSTDGAAWEIAYEPGAGGEPTVMMAYHPTEGVFVQVNATIYWSADGIAWTAILTGFTGSGVIAGPSFWATTVTSSLGTCLQGRTAVTANRPPDFYADYLVTALPRWFNGQLWALSGSKILVGGIL